MVVVALRRSPKQMAWLHAGAAGICHMSQRVHLQMALGCVLRGGRLTMWLLK